MIAAIKKQPLLEALREYRQFIARVHRLCQRIQQRYGQYIACQKNCPGNCCRIHLSVFPVEALALAVGLQKLGRKAVAHIRQKARRTTTFGPCPLLEKGACRMYAARAVICRTHGLPVFVEYRGHSSIGFCQKNFQNLPAIPDDAVIDLGRLNAGLAAVNRRFVSRVGHRLPPGDRFPIAQALLMEVADSKSAAK